MSGTIGLSLSQQLDEYGKPLAGGKLYFYSAGTSSPQNAFQDSALTIPLPNPYTLNARGRIPQFFLADGQIKFVLTDRLGVTQDIGDNIQVIGPSSGGGGGGGSVDPTTVLQTGWMQPIYGTGVVPGFVRMNDRTIGNAVSGATERANADTQALFVWLWNADSNLTVSGGRGISPIADYSAGKTIKIPDWRGADIRGLDDMGNTVAGRLTTATFTGLAPTALGAFAGLEKILLTQGMLPAVAPIFTGTLAFDGPTGPNGGLLTDDLAGASLGFGSFYGNAHLGLYPKSYRPAGTISNLGSGNPTPVMSPTRLCTIYLKL